MDYSRSFNREVMKVNEKFLKELSNELGCNIFYSNEDFNITTQIKELSFSIVLYDTRYEFVELSKSDIKQLMEKEIDRLTRLKVFNQNLPQLDKLIEVADKI